MNPEEEKTQFTNKAIRSLWTDPNNLKAAKGLISRGCQMSPSLTKEDRDLAWLLLCLDKLDEALVMYQRFAKVQPTDADAYDKIALIQHRLGHDDEALKTYELFLSETQERNITKNDYFLLQQNYIKFLIHIKQDQKAREYFEAMDDTSFEESDSYKDSYFYQDLTRLYEREGQPTKATQILEKIISQDPSCEALYHSLFCLFYENGYFEKALHLIEKTCKIFPLSLLAKVNNGLVLSQLNRFEEAQQKFEFLLHDKRGYLEEIKNQIKDMIAETKGKSLKVDDDEKKKQYLITIEALSKLV